VKKVSALFTLMTKHMLSGIHWWLSSWDSAGR